MGLPKCQLRLRPEQSDLGRRVGPDPEGRPVQTHICGPWPVSANWKGNRPRRADVMAVETIAF